MKSLVKKIPTNPPSWYEGLEIIDREEPQVSVERPVKLKTVSAGICGTDVGVYSGKDALANAMAKVPQENVILGHEFCARISEIHDSAKLFVAKKLLRHQPISEGVKDYVENKTAEQIAGDKNFVEFLKNNFYITAEMHFTCGTCLQCRIGEQHVCKNTIGKGLHEDGAFTDFMTVPADRIILIEDGEVPSEIISFMDALGNAVHTAQQVDLVGKTVLITGAGVQGLMSCAVAKQLGANKIFVTDVIARNNPKAVDKLGIAKKLGATKTFDVGIEEGRKDLTETIKKQTDDTGVDVIFEMSGNYNAYQQGFDYVRMGGTMLLLGLPAGKMEVDFSKDVVFKGITIKGVYGRRIFDTWSMMRYLLSKGLAKQIVDSGLITHQLPLEKFDEGFQALLSGEAIKVLLKP